MWSPCQRSDRAGPLLLLLLQWSLSHSGALRQMMMWVPSTLFITYLPTGYIVDLHWDINTQGTVMFPNLIALNSHLTTQQNAKHKIIDILVKRFFCAHTHSSLRTLIATSVIRLLSLEACHSLSSFLSLICRNLHSQAPLRSYSLVCCLTENINLLDKASS